MGCYGSKTIEDTKPQPSPSSEDLKSSESSSMHNISQMDLYAREKMSEKQINTDKHEKKNQLYIRKNIFRRIQKTKNN